ncbi:MAG: hypothetical protein ABID79_04135 [Elusimicrobiota bacterium]
MPCVVIYAFNYDKQIEECKQKIKESKIKLTDVQSKISNKKNNIKTIKKKETSLGAYLENTIRKLETTKTGLLKTKILIKKQQESIDTLKIKLEIAKLETIRWKNILKKELRFAHKYSVTKAIDAQYFPRIILSSNSSVDIAKRYRFLQIIARQKSFVYIQTLKNIQKYEILETGLETKMCRLKELEKEKKNSEQLYVKQKKEKEQLLSTVVKKRIFYEGELLNLKDSETMLSNLIILLRKKTAETAKQKKKRRRIILFKNVKKKRCYIVAY